MHKHTQHVGKVPASFPDLPGLLEEESPAPRPEATRLDKLSELKQALSKSVEDEDYEEAARLRDAISQMETHLSES